MKPAITFFLLLFTIVCFSQATDTLKRQPGDIQEAVSFVTKLDIANATKDGIYLNGYVVNISYEKARKLNGKTIRVTGKVRIVKGVQNRPKEDVQQGREGETKYIESPKIKIINK